MVVKELKTRAFPFLVKPRSYLYFFYTKVYRCDKPNIENGPDKGRILTLHIFALRGGIELLFS
jgi:hypothetical protein